jgi:hypothetical protein
MTTRPRADVTDDLLEHIERGPGRDPDGWSRKVERLIEAAPLVMNEQPSSEGQR